jgi:hypothetical protein
MKQVQVLSRPENKMSVVKRQLELRGALTHSVFATQGRCCLIGSGKEENGLHEPAPLSIAMGPRKCSLRISRPAF